MPSSTVDITDTGRGGWVLAHQYSDSASVDIQNTKGPALEVFVNTSASTKPADDAIGTKLIDGAPPFSVTLASTEALWCRVWQGYDDDAKRVLSKTH